MHERFLFTTTATFYILITLRDIVIRQGFVHSPQNYEYKTGFNATVHFFDNNGCTWVNEIRVICHSYCYFETLKQIMPSWPLRNATF